MNFAKNIDQYLQINPQTKWANIKQLDILQTRAIFYSNHNLDLYHFPTLTKFANPAPKFIIIPSIINGPEILYIHQDGNIIQTMQQQGDVYLVKWQQINNQNKLSNLDNYITDIIAIIDMFNNQDVHLIGHCLGGHIAMAASYFRQNHTASLTLLTTPWNFSHLKYIYPHAEILENIIMQYDYVPAILIEILFSYLDLKAIIHKYNSWQQSDLFCRIEYWLHSGNNISIPCFKQLLHEFIGQNCLAGNNWHVNGEHVDISKYNLPILLVTGQQDKIVPPYSYQNFIEQVPKIQHYQFNTGHIGYLVGNKRHIFLQKIQNSYKKITRQKKKIMA